MPNFNCHQLTRYLKSLSECSIRFKSLLNMIWYIYYEIPWLSSPWSLVIASKKFYLSLWIVCQIQFSKLNCFPSPRPNGVEQMENSNHLNEISRVGRVCEIRMIDSYEVRLEIDKGKLLLQIPAGILGWTTFDFVGNESKTLNNNIIEISDKTIAMMERIKSILFSLSLLVKSSTCWILNFLDFPYFLLFFSSNLDEWIFFSNPFISNILFDTIFIFENK